MLHAKLDEAHTYASSLEVTLKSPIANTCSSCENVATKNAELELYVDHLQNENDDLRECLSWLSGCEPQLGMMISQFKRADGRGLGFEKVGECSGERERETS